MSEDPQDWTVENLKAELSDTQARLLELQQRHNTLLVRDYLPQIRIEALRAAAALHGQVTSAAVGSMIAKGLSVDVNEKDAAQSAIDIAKQFAAYLETGE